MKPDDRTRKLKETRRRLRILGVCKLAYENQRRLLMFHGLDVIPWEQAPEEMVDYMKLFVTTMSSDAGYDHKDIYRIVCDTYAELKPYQELANYERAGIALCYESVKILMNRF